MKVSVVEDVLATLPLINTGTGEQSVDDVILKDGVVSTIEIPDIPTNRLYPFTLQTLPIYVRQQVRKALKSRLIKTLKENVNKDVRGMIEEEEVGSPPIIVKYEGDVDWNKFIKDNVDATYRVITTNNTNLQGVMFGEERVFRVNAPSWMKYKSNSFYKTQETELTCGYEYLTNFSKNPKNSCKKNGKNKEAIDNAVLFHGYKGDIYQQIYDNWLIQNRDKIDGDKNKERELHPIPEYIGVGDLYDEEGLYKVEECDINPYFSKYDEERSLSVRDLLKWCIASNVRLSVFDYDDTDYLSYNPADFYASYPDIQKKRQAGSIVVKIAHHHAYFVEDIDIKKSVSNSKTRHKMKLEDESWSNQKPKTNEEACETKDKEIDHHDNLYKDKHGTDFVPEKKPPPSISQLKEWAKDTNKLHHYYVGLKNLNGLVSILYREGIAPDKLTGGVHSIHTANFGSLKVLSSKTHYNYVFDDKYSNFYEYYPELKSPFGIQPTATTIGKALMKRSDPDESYLSMMNPQVKRMFYESEIKPDVRSCKYDREDREQPMAMSFDVCRAYTTALLHNEYEWNVYDVISQPKKYKGEFNPNYFYLCINKTEEYPCILGKGLILYHGSLLKYCLDKVDIKYYIPPKTTLPLDHFVKFVDECKEFVDNRDKYYGDGDPQIIGFDLPYNEKQLVNNFIGSLKNKDGIQQYGLYINTDKKSITRQFLKDYLPSRMNTQMGLTWRREPILTSKPQRLNHFENAQPIRLQVVSMCSEMNYKVYLHYQKCLYDYKLVYLQEYEQKKAIADKKAQEDLEERRELAIKQGKNPNRIRKRNFMNRRDKLFKYYDKPQLMGVNTDAIKVSTPFDSDANWFRILNEDEDWFIRDSAYQAIHYGHKPMDKQNKEFEYYVVDSFNKTNYIQIKAESFTDPLDIRTNIPQLGMTYMPNQWEDDLSVNKAWSRDTCGGLMLQSAIQNKGTWFAGLGGRGKTELILRMKEMCEENKKLYRWVKLISKLTTGSSYDTRQKYLDNNPISYVCLAPTNKSANLVEGKTLHKGLGIMSKDIDDDFEEDEIKEVKPYLKSIIGKMEGDRKNGIHPLGILAIDEISMISGEIWSYVSYIRERLPNLTIMLFGDIEHQLPPPTEEHRGFNHSYAIKCIANFSKITLNYNFRQGCSGDKLWELSADQSNFKCGVEPLTDKNLCWTNQKRKEVISQVQDTLVNPQVIEYESKGVKDPRQTLKYTYGTPLIARKSFIIDDVRVAKNEMWVVVNLDPVQLVKCVNDEYLDVKIEVDEDTILKRFLSGYCITIHKSQGETYKNKYTIHEWVRMEQSPVARKLRYTAISRSKNPENNILFRV